MNVSQYMCYQVRLGLVRLGKIKLVMFYKNRAVVEFRCMRIYVTKKSLDKWIKTKDKLNLPQYGVHELNGTGIHPSIISLAFCNFLTIYLLWGYVRLD